MAKQDSFGGYDENRFKGGVETNLLCSVCVKVLKDPVQCPNEHYFCRSCVCKSLRENSEACPLCKHHLTEENLTKPPRILREFLDKLEISCDYVNRGCQEFMKLQLLDEHLSSCGYSPTTCTNTGCAQEMNRNEKEQHEGEQCEFRKIVCEECKEEVMWKLSQKHPCFMQKKIDDLSNRLNAAEKALQIVQNTTRNNQNAVAAVQNSVQNHANTVTGIQTTMTQLQESVSRVQSDVASIKQFRQTGGSYRY